MPAVVTLQPAKVTMPAVSVPVQLDTVAPVVPVPAVMARVTVEASVVTVLANASWTVTAGWTAKGMPAVVVGARRGGEDQFVGRSGGAR